MRLLLIEDDRMVGEAVCKGLRQESFAIDWVQDSKAAGLAIETGNYDMLLLDLGLPDEDGLSLLARLRRNGMRLPVIILTARDAVPDRVSGLDAGADDYLVKPFDLEELLARIRALLRRQAGRVEPVIRSGDVTLNPATREVLLNGEPVNLSAREYALLRALLDRPGMVLSRSQLEEKLYGWSDAVESNAVEVYVHGLRRKLGAEFIRNVRGIGYMVQKEKPPGS